MRPRVARVAESRPVAANPRKFAAALGTGFAATGVSRGGGGGGGGEGGEGEGDGDRDGASSSSVGASSQCSSSGSSAAGENPVKSYGDGGAAAVGARWGESGERRSIAGSATAAAAAAAGDGCALCIRKFRSVGASSVCCSSFRLFVALTWILSFVTSSFAS